MQSRRSFIKIASGALAIGISGVSMPAFRYAFASETFPEPGVNLFTFFGVIDSDVEGTLKKISALGVKNIESAFSRKPDYYGYKAKEFSKLIQDLGMTWRSHHVFGVPFKMPKGNTASALPAMKNLAENTQAIIDEAAEGGLKYLVAAHFPITNTKEISDAINILNKAAETTKKAGIQLVYHNDAGDFKLVDGKSPYEVFLTESDPDVLKFELDLAWAIKGGQDPEKYFKRYPGRFPLWHMKDLDKTYSTVLPIGEGVLDNKKYFQQYKELGLKYYFLEHESAKDPFTSVAASINEIKKISHYSNH
jgi:sugar phosphate isomerase/epimerase